MSKKCPSCGDEIEYVEVRYYRYNKCTYDTREDEDGVDYDNEEESDTDNGDSEDYEYTCPECGDDIDCWDDLDNWEDEEEELDEEELIERDKQKRKQDLALKRQLKKTANRMILNGILNNIK